MAFTIVGCNFSHVWVLVFVDLQSIYSTVDQGLRGDLGLRFLARPAGQSVVIPAGQPARRVYELRPAGRPAGSSG